MAVYVDPIQNCPTNKNWPYTQFCHMIADTPKELKAFALIIDLKLSWYQEKSFPHFDLTKSRRVEAIKMGAIDLNLRQFVKKMQEIRGNG